MSCCEGQGLVQLPPCVAALSRQVWTWHPISLTLRQMTLSPHHTVIISDIASTQQL